jgi:radical SAM superfamily enzyme YgiQ (UPF0313 family)
MATMVMSNRKKIVLIYPRLEKYNPERIHYFPLPILAVAGSLLREGYEVTIFDNRVEEGLDQFLDSLEEEPIFFGLSVIIGYPIVDGLQLSRRIKARFPNIPVVWGGWFPTLEPVVTLKENSVDLVVRGPGERTVVRLARSLEKKGDLGSVGALAYRQNGKIIVNDSASPADINKTDPLPYHILDPSKYNCIQRKEINYITSHGCPYDCRFCCVTYIYHRRWCPIAAERVVEDISHLVHHYGIENIEFQDDNFFTNKSRAKAILEGILSSNLKITWTGQVRFDKLISFDEELFDLIKRSGCRCLYASGESGSEKILKVIRKRITTQQTLSGVKLLEKHDIALRTTFMVGLPKETLDDLKMSLDLSKRLIDIKKRIHVYYSFYRPVPSTELFNEALEEQIITKPKTLDEWARYVPVDQKQFWLFLKENTTKLRNDAKKLSFYFWFANYRPFLENVRDTKVKFLLRLVRPIFQFRYQHKLLFFSVEWYLFNLLYKLRPDVFYRGQHED